jgi:hypothetical protein
VAQAAKTTQGALPVLAVQQRQALVQRNLAAATAQLVVSRLYLLREAVAQQVRQVMVAMLWSTAQQAAQAAAGLLVVAAQARQATST